MGEVLKFVLLELVVVIIVFFLVVNFGLLLKMVEVVLVVGLLLKRVEVCMGGKCKKLGGIVLLDEF